MLYLKQILNLLRLVNVLSKFIQVVCLWILVVSEVSEKLLVNMFSMQQG